MVMKKNLEPAPEFRIVPAGEFKARCLQLMDEVYENIDLTIIITKRGKPVAQMTAPPTGLKLSGPTVELHTDTYLKEPASTAFEKHRDKKRKDKKKRK
jgi:antitoxin (DNA-binding transcriptional repressor) of toxin-antitoxin stability system